MFEKSFAEQVTVCAGAGQCQHQYIILNPINKKPVRLNMAFPVSHPIIGQLMIVVQTISRFIFSVPEELPQHLNNVSHLDLSQCVPLPTRPQ